MGNSNENTVEKFIGDVVHEAQKTARPSGGRFATIISAFALLFSSYSFYETVLKAPNFAIYVPPRIDYTDPDRPDKPLEVFILPLTLANDGARTGTILSIDLAITNPRTKQTKRFYASHLGSWGQTPRKPFTPVALAGKASFSDAVQFIPRMSETIERILDFEAGNYQFELRLNTATTGGDIPFLKTRARSLQFEMQISKLNYFNFRGIGTMPMWSKDYRPAKTTAK